MAYSIRDDGAPTNKAITKQLQNAMEKVRDAKGSSGRIRKPEAGKRGDLGTGNAKANRVMYSFEDVLQMAGIRPAKNLTK